MRYIIEEDREMKLTDCEGCKLFPGDCGQTVAPDCPQNPWLSQPDNNGWWWYKNIYGIAIPAWVLDSYVNLWQREKQYKISSLSGLWQKIQEPEEK